MANVIFGNVAADMRLTDSSYGISALVDFEALIWDFVSVSEQVLYEDSTVASVRLYDANGASVTITIQGDFTAHTANYFVIEAMGIEVDVSGSFTITEEGEVFGVGTEYNARWAQDDTLIVRFSNVNVPFDSGQIELPDDPAVLAGTDSIVAGDGPFYLLGYGGNDTLSTGTGNDTLDGGAGVDTMTGGDGEDTYYVDNAADTTNETEYWNGVQFVNPTDRVYATASYTLGVNVEQLILLGTDPLGGTGNALDNEISGNAGSNALQGLAGADLFTGGGGNDTIDGGAGNDTARFTSAARDYSLTTDSDLQRLYVTGSGAGAADGADALTAVENLSFSDRVLGFAFRGEFHANATATGFQQAPVVVGLTDGGYLAAWSDDSPFGIEARRFSAGGVPQSSDQGISTYTGVASMQSTPALTRQSDGTLVAAWTSNLQDGNLTGVYARHLDAQGVPLGDEFLVNGTTAGYQHSASTAALSGGGFVAVWTSSQIDVYDVFARRFTADGVPVGSEFPVNTYTPWYQDSPVVAGTSDGGFVVVWESTVDQGVHSGIYARRFDANGMALGDEFLVNTYVDPMSPFKANPAIAPLGAGGGFVVAWDSWGQDGSGQGIYAQRFGAAGSRLGSEFRLNTTTAGDQFEASLAPTLDGGFFAAWTSLPGGKEAVVATQRFDAEGNKVGDETLIHTPLAGDRAEPAVATLIDGRIVTLWRTTDAEAWGISGREFDSAGQPAAEAVIAGSAAADVVRADAGVQFVEGYGGDDRLVGGSGDDTLSGGEGNDTLDGGAGNDDLFGGTGDDVLWGAVGSDRLVGGPGHDYLHGNGGSDSYDGGPGIDTAIFSTSSAAIEVDLATGACSGGDAQGAQLVGIESVRGTSHDDVLKGDGFGNVFDGGAGIDRMYGRAGDDLYFVDSQADLVFEGVGDGVDGIISAASFYLYANVENLTMTGSAFYGVGNALDNSIVGNDEQNLLIGWAGNDTIDGGASRDALHGLEGNDTLYGRAGIDYVAAGTGNDTIDGGNDADEAYGEDGNDLIYGGDDFATDILVGGAGNDTIDGGQAWDLMYGNSGDDTFYVSQQVDWVFEQPNEGTDTVIADSPNGYYLYANVENLTLAGVTSFGVGNELDNTLTGNTASNLLLGGWGNDRLNGKGGNDVLWGEGGADTFVFERATGIDNVGGFVPGTDKVELSGLGYSSYAQIQSLIFQSGVNTGINLGQGEVVVLVNVTAASLTAADFVFS